MIKKKSLNVLTITCLLLSILVIPANKTLADNGDGVCIPKEYIIELDDNEGAPYNSINDYDRVVDLINNPPADRTGWSAMLFEYRPDLGEVVMPDGSITYWHERPYDDGQKSSFNTIDSWPETTHNPLKYSESIIKVYGEEVYNALIKSGQQMVPIYGDDYLEYDRNESYFHSWQHIKNPQKGDRAFTYYNSKVEVKFTIECDEEGEVPEIPCLDCEVEVPEIGNGNYCSDPFIPSQIEDPFVYKMDLITERIEGKTVDKGKQTVTPITVYRADFSDYRNEIKDNLNDDLIEHQSKLVECETIIKNFESELKALNEELNSLNSQLSSVISSYNVCLNTSYPVYDEDGEIVDWEPADCSGYPPRIYDLEMAIAQKRIQIREKEEQIRLANITLEEIKNVSEAIRKYIDIIISAESQYETIPTQVALEADGQRIETKNITLKEDERKILKYTWKLENDSLIKGIIDPNDDYPLCDESFDVDPCMPCEVTHDNNEKETPIYISTREAVNACSIDGTSSTLSAIVRTIQEGDSLDEVENVYEYATSYLVIDSEEKSRRAGYGFHYKVFTEYKNEDVAEDRGTKGVNGAVAFKPDLLASHIPYSFEQWESMKTSSTQVSQNTLNMEGFKVPGLDNTNADTHNSNGLPFIESKEWELPQFSVEKYSGNVFVGNKSAANNHSLRNANDELLDGGRKWYLDFYQPDGTFSFNVLTEDIGVNRLTLCNLGEVEVKGTSIGDENGDSDFVFRFVDAAEPFPAGTGWNWIGQESLIVSLKNWWEDWNYPDPTTIPSNYHQYEFRIEHE
jgi:hypothetical protein